MQGEHGRAKMVFLDVERCFGFVCDWLLQELSLATVVHHNPPQVGDTCQMVHPAAADRIIELVHFQFNSSFSPFPRFFFFFFLNPYYWV